MHTDDGFSTVQSWNAYVWLIRDPGSRAGQPNRAGAISRAQSTGRREPSEIQSVARAQSRMSLRLPRARGLVGAAPIGRSKGRSVYCWQRMVVLVGCAFVRFVSYTSVGGPQGRDIRLGNDRQRLKRVTFHHDPPRKRGGNRRLQDSAGRGRTADVSTSEVSRSRRSAPCTTDTRRHRELSIA